MAEEIKNSFNNNSPLKVKVSGIFLYVKDILIPSVFLVIILFLIPHPLFFFPVYHPLKSILFPYYIHSLGSVIFFISNPLKSVPFPYYFSFLKLCSFFISNSLKSVLLSFHY